MGPAFGFWSDVLASSVFVHLPRRYEVGRQKLGYRGAIEVPGYTPT
jgi:hypothetical protein